MERTITDRLSRTFSGEDAAAVERDFTLYIEPRCLAGGVYAWPMNFAAFVEHREYYQNMSFDNAAFVAHRFNAKTEASKAVSLCLVT